MDRKTRSWMMPVLLLAMALLLCACGQETADEGGGDAETSAIAVEVAAARVDTIVDGTVVRGNVSASEDVYVVPKASGVVRSVYVAVGDYVSQGQTICQLDTVDLQTTLALAQSQYNTLYTAYQEAVKNRDRYEALYKEGAVSLVQYEQAQAAVDQMGLESVRLQVQQVQDQINNCTVTSTISGMVAELAVDPGDMAGGSYVARIVNNDKVQLVANVTESVIGRLSQGMELTVHIESASAEPYTGVITGMPVAANATMTYPVEITIDNPEREIMAGMFAEVDIVRDQVADVIVIPKVAVDQDNVVYVVKDGKAQAVTVTTGLADENYIEITSGIAEDDQVVTAGAYLLTDGDAVRVVNTVADTVDTADDTADNTADDAADDTADDTADDAADDTADDTAQ